MKNKESDSIITLLHLDQIIAYFSFNTVCIFNWFRGFVVEKHFLISFALVLRTIDI